MLRSILSAFLIASLVAPVQAMADQETGIPKTAQAIVTAYGDAGATGARTLAQADYQFALAQLELARAEVERLIGEIRIEGAEAVDIGGEVRAARMTEASWQRAAETVFGYIQRLDSAIAKR